MAFCFRVGRSLEDEVRRIAGRQFEQAVEAMLLGVGGESDRAKYRARRHIKKLQALMQLVDVKLTGPAGCTPRHLRLISRRLAVLADAEATVDTLGRLEDKHGAELDADASAELRAELLEREARIRRRVKGARVPQGAARLFTADAARTPRWSLRQGGVHAVLRGFTRTVRRMRRAMARARARPTVQSYHRWRQRTKDQWLQVRLLCERCGGRLGDYEAQLEQLDGCLGELHNCALLADAVRAGALASRLTTAKYLRVIRKYRRELRAEAAALSQQVDRHGPRRTRRRVRRYWRLANHDAKLAAKARSWPRTA